MTVFRSLEAARDRFGPCALAIGNFDGVHVGHQALLDETARFASDNNYVPAALTFHPHPAAIVAPERLPPLVCSLERRIRLLAAAGAEHILVLPFTEQIAHLSPEEFVSQILVNVLNTKAVFVGENFRFGHKQAGTPAVLKALSERYGFVSRFLPPVSCRGEMVSSSAIRKHLIAGRVSRAARLLGRCFSLEGPIVAGHGVGSKQTVPTLNLQPPSDQVIPRGVFITQTLETPNGRRWPSITNAGMRPTFHGTELTVETFLLSPLDGEPPQYIQVNFHWFVRPEREFPNAAELKAQILKDVSRAQKYWHRVSELQTRIVSVY
jgi:riboflavin kinase / FMN adenylyltransferase